jgi:hypothetical protein
MLGSEQCEVVFKYAGDSSPMALPIVGRFTQKGPTNEFLRVGRAEMIQCLLLLRTLGFSESLLGSRTLLGFVNLTLDR